MILRRSYPQCLKIPKFGSLEICLHTSYLALYHSYFPKCKIYVYWLKMLWKETFCEVFNHCAFPLLWWCCVLRIVSSHHIGSRHRKHCSRHCLLFFASAVLPMTSAESEGGVVDPFSSFPMTGIGVMQSAKAVKHHPMAQTINFDTMCTIACMMPPLNKCWWRSNPPLLSTDRSIFQF